MKIVFLICTLISFSISAQIISGEAKEEKRTLLSATDFSITGSKSGDIYYELAIDREGNVTSSRLMNEKTTIISTPTRMRAKEYVSTFKFDKGTHFPHFQNVVVCIKVKLN
jgi:hypothetical protein